jgi:hypothetical protein
LVLWLYFFVAYQNNRKQDIIKKPPAILLTNGFCIFYLLTRPTVAGHKTLQRLTLQHQHGHKKEAQGFSNEYAGYGS